MDSNTFSKKQTFLFAALCVLILASFIAVNFTITGNFEGLFLLRGTDGYWFEIKDDLLLNEGRRYIAGIDFEPAKKLIRSLRHIGSPPDGYLSVEWNDKLGDGYVRNYLPGGRQLLTCLSRFIDDDGKAVKGIFVGGGLPANVHDDDRLKENETGMAYYDGTRWYHLWCNVNEALFSMNRFEPIPPSAWTFLGSRVLNREETHVLLESVHEAVIDGVPLRINRYAAFRAGETYFLLSVYITNIGSRPVTYSYQYGDEPWLGNYGSSAGNVGWTADGLKQFVGRLPTGKYTYAGFFDHGNNVIGEQHRFTDMADFIEWFGTERPELYFSNGPYDNPNPPGRPIPLAGNTRFIGLLWGARTVQPGETVNYTLAIGMAERDPATGLPKKPAVDPGSFP